jgi:alpha-mannosidase
MIIRLYEAFGGRCNATIRVAPGFTRAFLCDLMENVEKELPLADDTVTLPVSNFEIVTLKFTR